MAIYVVTNPKLGWDCVKNVYEANFEKQVKIALLEEQGYTLKTEPENWEDNNCIHSIGNIIKLN
jgi:hypothetical protein